MRILRKFWALFRRQQLDADMTAEIRLHLEMQAAENLRRGMSPDEARYSARRQFGGVDQIKEIAREQRGWSWLEQSAFDLRYGVRQLRRSPGFAVVAILSLALGIGANTAIFNLFNSTFLNDVSAREPDQLLHLDFGRANQVSNLNYRDLRASGVVAGLAGYQNSLVNWSRGDVTVAVRGQIVTGNFFDLLGVQAGIGQVFTEADDSVEKNPGVVVISHRFWQQRLSGDSDILGKALRINGQPFTIIGVLSREHRPVSEIGTAPELYLPLSALLVGGLNDRSQLHVELLARVAPPSTRPEAVAGLTVAAKQLEERFPGENRGFGHVWRVHGLTKWERLQQVGSSSLPKFFALMLAMVGLVLLIACTNVAGLLLARATSRRREIAVRLTLGASRARIVRQLLAESALLAGFGGGLGLLLNFWLTSLFVRLPLPSSMPVEFLPKADGSLLLYALGLATVAAVLCGLVPALQATRPSLAPALKREEPQFLHRRFTLRNGLVIGQVAVSLVLLVTASLFLRSLRHMSKMETGFDTEHTLTVQVNPSGSGSSAATGYSTDAVVERLAALPGVRSASSAAIMPLSFNGAYGPVRVEGREHEPIRADLNTVGARFFETMGIAIREGREFLATDWASSPSVAVVNETFARRYFPGQNPIGRQLRMKAYDGREVSWEIVGIAADARYSLREAPAPQVYWPNAQPPPLRRYLAIVVGATGSPAALMPAVERAVKELAPAATIEIALMRDQVAAYLFPSRIAAWILAGLGALGLLLATIGLYGVIAYTVNRRTAEFGVRVALGATPRAIFSLVVRDGLMLVGTGLAVGVVVSLVLTRPLAQLLAGGVSVADPLALAGTVALLFAVGFTASFWPAWRAAKVDPMVALRAE